MYIYIYVFNLLFIFRIYHQFDLTPSNPHPSPLVLGYELPKFRFARSDCFAVIGLQLQAGNQGQQRESGQAGNLRRQRHAGKKGEGRKGGGEIDRTPDKPPIFRAFWVKTAQLPVTDSIGWCHRTPVEVFNGWNLGKGPICSNHLTHWSCFMGTSYLILLEFWTSLNHPN